MKSRPREHARKEGFKSISSDASSICHKTSSKLFLVIDILHLLHCFKICFNHALPFPTGATQRGRDFGIPDLETMHSGRHVNL